MLRRVLLIGASRTFAWGGWSDGAVKIRERTFDLWNDRIYNFDPPPSIFPSSFDLDDFPRGPKFELGGSIPPLPSASPQYSFLWCFILDNEKKQQKNTYFNVFYLLSITCDTPVYESFLTGFFVPRDVNSVYAWCFEVLIANRVAAFKNSSLTSLTFLFN